MFTKTILSLLFIQEAAGACANSCKNCIAIPGNLQLATDAQCKPCGANGQEWWPCNNADLCHCNDDGSATPVPTGVFPMCEKTVAIPGNPHNASDAHCGACAMGAQKWWPCDNAALCKCAGGSTNPTTAAPPVTTAQPTPTEAPVTTAQPTPTEAPVTTAAPETTAQPETTEAPVTTAAPETTTAQPEPNSVLDTKTRKAQASVFGDYESLVSNGSLNSINCAMDESDAKDYVNPKCATAINMGSGQWNTVDRHGNAGFCVRTVPGIFGGAPKSSSCWKVRCVGTENQFNLGVSCGTSEPIYLKTVDTNTEQSDLTLVDDEFSQQCDDSSATWNTNTPSCRAFDITVNAWNLIAVFAQNQGSLAGEPAGLNGALPVEYEEVDCNDPVVKAAVQSDTCGLNRRLDIIV